MRWILLVVVFAGLSSSAREGKKGESVGGYMNEIGSDMGRSGIRCCYLIQRQQEGRKKEEERFNARAGRKGRLGEGERRSRKEREEKENKQGVKVDLIKV